MKKIFFDSIGYANITRADAKRVASDNMITEVIEKAYQTEGNTTWMRDKLKEWHEAHYRPLVDSAIATKNAAGGFIPNFKIATPGADYMSRHDKAKIAIDDSSSLKSIGKPFQIYEKLLDHWSVNQVRMPVEDVKKKFPQASVNDRARANQLLILGEEKKGKVLSPNNPAYNKYWPNIYDAVNRRTGATEPEILRNEPDWPDSSSPVAKKAIEDAIWNYAAPAGATRGGVATATEGDQSIADYISDESRGDSGGAGLLYARAGHALSELTDSQNFLSTYVPRYRKSAGLNIMDSAAVMPAGAKKGTWANKFNDHYGKGVAPPLTIKPTNTKIVSGLLGSTFPFKGIHNGRGQSFTGLTSPRGMDIDEKNAYFSSQYNAQIDSYGIHERGVALSKAKLQSKPFYWDEDDFEDQINQWSGGTWAGSRTLAEAPLDFSNPLGEAKFGTKGPGASDKYIVGKLLRHLIGTGSPTVGRWPARFTKDPKNPNLNTAGAPLMGQTIPLGGVDLIKAVASGFIPNMAEGQLEGMGMYSEVYDKEDHYSGDRTLDIGYLSSGDGSGRQMFKTLLDLVVRANKEGNPFTDVDAGSVIGPRIPSVLMKSKKLLDRVRAKGEDIPFMKVGGIMSPPAALLSKLQNKKEMQEERGVREIGKNQYKTGEEKELIKSLRELGLDPTSEKMVMLDQVPMLQQFASGHIPNYADIDDRQRAQSSYESIKTKDWTQLKESGKQVRKRILNASHFFPLKPKSAIKTMYKDVLQAGDSERPYTDIEAGEIAGPRIPSIIVRAKEMLDRVRAKGRTLPLMNIDGFFEPTWLMGTIQRQKNEYERGESEGSNYYYPGEEKDLLEALAALGANPESPADFQLANSPLFTNGFAKGLIPNFQLNKSKGKIASQEEKQLERDLTDAKVANTRGGGEKHIIDNNTGEMFSGSDHQKIATAHDLFVNGRLPDHYIKNPS